MKKIMLAALAAGAVAMSAAPVLAAGESQYAGGCAFAAISDPTPDGNLGGQGVFTGEVDYQIVLFNQVDAAANPVSATVSCELQVNGVVQDSTAPTSVTVAGAGADVLTYTKAADSDVVELCTVVTGWSDGTANVRDCGPATTTQIPPQEVIDILDTLFQTLTDLEIALIDPTLCPILISLAPGVPGVVDINSQGDVFVAGEPQWDCPPYDLFPPA